MIVNKLENNASVEALYKLNLGYSLSTVEAQNALKCILCEENTQKRINIMISLLTGIMVKGPTVDEVCGLLNAALEMDEQLTKPKKKLDLPCERVVVGVASSGKKGVKTINITSGACFIAAACGADIVKACSHATSSKTGSSDFLSICGFNIGIPFEKKRELQQKFHISFFSIEDTTPKFADVYKSTFYVPHAMSFALAGLSFPVEIDALAYGLSHPNVRLSAEVLKRFHIHNAMIYSSTLDGIHYMDELFPTKRVNVSLIKNGQISDMEDLEYSRFFSDSDIADLLESEGKLTNVIRTLHVIKGDGIENQVDVLCLNAAFFLFLARKVESIEAGYQIAKDSVHSGRAWSLFLDVLEEYGGNRDYIDKIMGLC